METTHGFYVPQTLTPKPYVDQHLDKQPHETYDKEANAQHTSAAFAEAGRNRAPHPAQFASLEAGAGRMC